MITLSLPASFIAWILLLNVLSHLPYNPKWGPAVSFDGYSVSLIEVVEMVVGAGVLWFPYLMACLLRDYFLHRTLRNKLVGCKCPNCSYSLLGLQTIGLRYGRGVQCPECGHEVYFQTSHIREEDLNPVSLTEP